MKWAKPEEKDKGKQAGNGADAYFGGSYPNTHVLHPQLQIHSQIAPSLMGSNLPS